MFNIHASSSTNQLSNLYVCVGFFYLRLGFPFMCVFKIHVQVFNLCIYVYIVLLSMFKFQPKVQ